MLGGVVALDHAAVQTSLMSVINLNRFPWFRGRAAAADADLPLLERLRAGDEDAFVTLVGRHNDSMQRLALTFVHSHAVAEEVVQDTWLGVLRGIDRFEGRSSLRTWLLTILVNRARSTGVREARSVPIGGAEPAVDASRFDSGGLWSSPPERWTEQVEERIGATALREQILAALAAMPERQRAVVMLRDVDGLRSDEVCDVLALTAANERVLLHRGRSRLRQALESRIGASA
jgi:RNA polymerase sigma-70 factor (ECF subfamily)